MLYTDYDYYDLEQVKIDEAMRTAALEADLACDEVLDCIAEAEVSLETLAYLAHRAEVEALEGFPYESSETIDLIEHNPCTRVLTVWFESGDYFEYNY